MSNTMKKNFFILLALTFLTVIFEILPFGVRLYFAHPDGDPILETFSYWSITPYGYATFSQFPASILTIAIFILAAVGFFMEKRTLLLVYAIVSAVAALLSFVPYFDGSFTWVSFFISILLCGATAYGFYSYKKYKEAEA